MLSRFTREFNRFYLNNNPVTGVQSIASSYQSPAAPIKYLGSTDSIGEFAPVGPYIGALDVTTLFVNSDPYINYIGEEGANLKIEYGKNQFIKNSGYLSDYTFECSIGSIPTINTKWNVYNDFGSGINSPTAFEMDESQLNIVNPGDIEVVFPELETEKINNLTVNIKTTRLPIFDLSQIKPVEVKLQYPIITTVVFSISLGTYKTKNIFDFPRKKNAYDFTINLRRNNSNSLVNSFQINDALLTSEDLNMDIDGSALMKLTYTSIINR